MFYTFPYLGIIFLPMSILYYFLSSYYRRSSVETKRLDSLMRSVLYASFSGWCSFITLFWHMLMTGRRDLNRFSNHTRLSRAGSLYTWRGNRSELRESCLLHDNFHSTMARCASGPICKHPHFWNCAIRCWIPSYNQPSQGWGCPIIYPQ